MADREIGVFQQAAPPTKLRIEFPHETGLILSAQEVWRSPEHRKEWTEGADHQGCGERSTLFEAEDCPAWWGFLRAQWAAGRVSFCY